MELTGTAKLPVKPLLFTLPVERGPLNRAYGGMQAISADYTRIYHVINEGTGVSDGYSLRVNHTWMPYRGTMEEMFMLAQNIEAQNSETEE